MTKPFTSLLAQAFSAVLFTFLLVFGANTSGLLSVPIKAITGILACIGVVAWLLVRARHRWKWHVTPIDNILWLWAVAFALSSLANTDSWRRIAMGLWFMGCYFACWYLVQDVVANRGLRRVILVDLALMTGLIALAFGCIQLVSFLQAWLAFPAETRPEFVNAVRVYDPLGNPNQLATFLTMLAPLAITRALLSTNRAVRLVLALYALLATTLCLSTFSRAGWIGLGVAIMSLAVLLIVNEWDRVRRWLSALPPTVRRRLVYGALGGLLLAVMAGGLFVAGLSSTGGRSLGLRTFLWDTALTMIEEKPLTGYGLWSFGRHLLRLQSVPYAEAHFHAHSAPLHIAAETGLVGLGVTLLTLAILMRAAWRNWREAPRRDRLLLIGCGAGLIGLIPQNLLDFTLTLPALVLTMLLFMGVSITPWRPVAVSVRRNRWQTGLVLVLVVTLFVSGIWSNLAYKAHIDALRLGIQERQYVAAAQAIEQATAIDPALPIYWLYRGLYWGLADAADNDDGGSHTDARAKSIAAYETFVQLEPYFAPAWANLSVLYRANGELRKAIDAMQRAVAYAPDVWMQGTLLGDMYEQADDDAAAESAYRTVLERAPDASAYPVWRETPLRLRLSTSPEIVSEQSVPAHLAWLIGAGQLAQAAEFWQSADRSAISPQDSALVELALAAYAEDWPRADSQLATLQRLGGSQDLATLVGKAYLADARGDALEAAAELTAVHDQIDDLDFFLDVDYAMWRYPNNQWARLGSPPFYLPQVGLPRVGHLLTQFILRAESPLSESHLKNKTPTAIQITESINALRSWRRAAYSSTPITSPGRNRTVPNGST